MLDSPEGVCAGQALFEYPHTSVPFSSWSQMNWLDHAQDGLPHRGACAGSVAGPVALAQDAGKDSADFASQAESV